MTIKTPALIFCIALTSVAAAADPDTQVVSLLAQRLVEIARNQHRPVLTVALGRFTYQYSGFGGPFSRRVEELVTRAADRTRGRVRIFALASWRNLEPKLRDAYKGLFDVGMVEAVVSGRYFPGNGVARVNLEVVDFSDGTVIGTGAVDIPLPPGSAAIEPPGLAKAMEVLGDIDNLVDGSGFEIRLSTSRGDGAVYREGERLQVVFMTTEDAYVRLFHVSSAGKATLIFPNRFHPDQRVPAGTLVTIPGANHGFEFLLEAPFGVEFIKAVASKTPFTDNPEPLVDLGKADRRSLTRGLRVTEKQDAVAEATVAFSITPRGL